MFADDLLAKHVVFITGGSSGLGLSMARRFVSLGAKVAICGRNPDKLQRARQELEELGGEVKAFQVDVRDAGAVERMIRDTVAHFGELTDLVNNAAGNFLSATEDLTPNAFRAVVDIVLFGTFYATLYFGRYLIGSGKPGSILNILAPYAETGSAFVVPSASAKAGVLAMTRSLAYEWGTYGIRVNAIAPGPFPTKGAWQRLVPDERLEKAFLAKIPLGRFGRHEELANLAAFLLSDLSPYLTGECITIDGGEHLHGGMFNFLDQLAPREELKAMFAQLRPQK